MFSVKMESRLSPEAEMIYKKIGRQRYTRLVKDMKDIVDKFKARQSRHQDQIVNPLTPSTEVSR